MFVVCDKNFSSLQRLREPAVSGRQLQEQTTKRRCMEGHSQEAKPDRDDEFTTATKHVGWRTNAGGSSPALISTGSRPGLLRYIPALEGDLPDSGSGPALDQHIPHLAITGSRSGLDQHIPALASTGTRPALNQHIQRMPGAANQASTTRQHAHTRKHNAFQRQEITNFQAQLVASLQEEKKDEDFLFAKSIVPNLPRLLAIKKGAVKLKIHQLLYDAEFS
ncbi:uncharacterized protein LOC125894709 isoform X2 [Epinephelus fuscoguttatus]|nr:uncharacterized protein LOC125894709 isoform X2 [Epinephelus fuscoguttatus]